MIMYAPYGDLAGFLRKVSGYRLPEHEAKELCRQLLEALDYLHGRAVVHHNVKPENTLILSSSPRHTSLVASSALGPGT